MKSLNLLKVVGVTLILSVFSGCHTIKRGEIYDWQGKMVRADVRIQYVNTPSNGTSRRAALVRTQEGGLTGQTRLFGVLVPDNIEFSDLEVGSIVDVIFERGDSDYKMDEGHFQRIVRLICKASDKDCVSKEWASGRMNQVIDANPGDDKAKYGTSYVRKGTQEEFDKYYKK